jgi:hypothetical protein
MTSTKATKKAAASAIKAKPGTKMPTAPSKAGATLEKRSSEQPVSGAKPAPFVKKAAPPAVKATIPVAPELSESEIEAKKAKIDEAADAKKKDRAPSSVQLLAQELIAQGDSHATLRHLAALEDEREGPSTLAARLVLELAELKPELLVPLIERFSRLLISKNRRVVASAAAALAPLSRIAPAKVAKQLNLLTQNWEQTSEEGQDGLVRTFAGLCTASVAYQKRLEPALARALSDADPKMLIRWTEIVLPALKGEPHARARAVVESRLPNIPRPMAQKIADFLGIKLRPIQR